MKRGLMRKLMYGIGLTAGVGVFAFSPGSYAQDSSQQDNNFHHAAGHQHLSPEQRLDKLKSTLQIQPNQEGAWQAYAAAVQKFDAERKAQWEQHKQSSKTLTLPQRIDQREAAFQQMHSSHQVVNDALKHLYGSLTKQQQATLEQHFSHKHHRRPMKQG